MGSYARRSVITLRSIQPASLQDHVGHTGRDVPEHVAVSAFTGLRSRTNLPTLAPTDAGVTVLLVVKVTLVKGCHNT